MHTWCGQWATWGDASTLVCQVEDSLSIAFARLIILDLLAKRHAACAQLMTATGLLQLLAPHFPHQPGASFRELFSSGPHRDIRALIDQAMSGWFSALHSDVLTERLVHLSYKCEQALRYRAACAVRICTIGVCMYALLVYVCMQLSISSYLTCHVCMRVYGACMYVRVHTRCYGTLYGDMTNGGIDM